MLDESFLEDLFKSLDEPKTEITPSGVLLVDSTNLFIRNFSVSTHINRFGEHVGGLVGFLKSLGFIVRNLKPRKIVLVFDGEGNSINKKYIYPEYKANRGTGRIINFKVHNSKEEEEESMDNQMGRLISYLKNLPVSLVSISNHEADDVIGFLAGHYKQTDDVVILSTDRDYYQLIDDKVKVFNPRTKEMVDDKKIFNEFGVHSNNFLILKALIGDVSDNVPGVQGVKEKTAVKLFPELKEEKTLILSDIYELSAERIKENKIYSRILGFTYQLEINYKLMNLISPNIGDSYKESILESVGTVYKTNQTNIRLLMESDKIRESFNDIWANDSFGYLK